VNLSDVDALERGVAAARPPATAAPVRVSADQLKRTRYFAPEYPRDAVQQGIEGSVRVRFTIGTEGKVTEASVVQATPTGVFDRAALAAVRRWRFAPVVVNGSVTEAAMETTVSFKMDDEAKH